MTVKNSPLTIWLLSDGAAGHLSQSRGVAEAIGRFCSVHTIEIDLRVRWRVLKSLLRYVLPYAGSMAERLLRLTYTITLPEQKPDLIVSSGGNTLLANALLAKCFSVPNFYSGTLKGYPASCYCGIFSVTPQGCDNNVVLPLPPVPLALTESFAPLVDAPWLVLIGGDGAGYTFGSDDWSLLADGMNHLGYVNGVRWLLTTSRRTGSTAENLLESRIDRDLVSEAVYYGRTPRPVVREFLANCQGVLVTEDSLTMVSEAIYSGRPVVTLVPRNARPDANDSMALNGYAKQGLIARLSLTDFAQFQLPEYKPTSLPDVPKLIWESVRTALP